MWASIQSYDQTWLVRSRFFNIGVTTHFFVEGYWSIYWHTYIYVLHAIVIITIPYQLLHYYIFVHVDLDRRCIPYCYCTIVPTHIYQQFWLNSKYYKQTRFFNSCLCFSTKIESFELFDIIFNVGRLHSWFFKNMANCTFFEGIVLYFGKVLEILL